MSAVAAAPPHATVRRRSRFGGLLRLMCPSPLAALVCLLVCVAAPVSVVAVHISQSPSFSTEDEVQHYDYVQRIANGSIPRLGERVLPSTTELARCVGEPAQWSTLPRCHGASRKTLNRFFHSPHNAQYEAQQPPLYYAVTAVIRWPFSHILGMKSLPATRMTGALWLAAGLLLMWLAAVILGISWPMAAAAALFIAAAPNVVLASSIVNNDASSVLAGGVVAVLGAMAWRRPGQLPWWVFGLAGVALVALKTTFAMPIVPVSGLLALAAWSQRERGVSSWRALRSALLRWLPTGGALFLSAIVGGLVWSTVFKHISLVNPKTFLPIHLTGGTPTNIPELMAAVPAMFEPFVWTPAPDFQWNHVGGYGFSQWSLPFQVLDGQVIDAITASAGFAWLFVKQRDWSHWVGAVSLPTLYFGGWAIGLSIMITYAYNTSLPGRYGISVGVLMILALVDMMRSRWPKYLFAAVSVISFGFAFWFILV